MTVGAIGPARPGANFRRRFLIFLVPGLYQSALPFLTLPLVTLVLGPSDFALFSVVNAVIALLVTLSQLGSVFSLARRFASTHGDIRRALVGTITIQVLILSVLFASIIVVFWPIVREYWSVGAKVTMPMIVLMAVAMIGMSLSSLARTLAVYGHQPGYFSLMIVVEASASVAVTLAALFVLHLHVVSLFVGRFAAGLVDLFGSLLLLWPFLTYRFDRIVARECLSLGGWSSGAQLALQGYNILERSVLSTAIGLYETGLFVHAQQYQNYVLLGARPLQQAVMPTMLEEARAPTAEFVRTGQVYRILFFAITVLGFTFALLGRDIIDLMTHGKFDAAAPYAALLIGALLLQFAGRPQYARLLSQARGRYLSIGHIISVAGATLVLVVFAPHFGIAAAVAAIYFQFAFFRIAIEFDDWRAGRHLPFQDIVTLFGILMIGSAVSVVEFWDPALWPRIILLVAGLMVTVAVHQVAIRDMLIQAREAWASLIGWRARPTGS